ncbi:iron ABC transporter permease protein [Haladaptatus paucihalophilus DX253]|uniref:Iron ABC transporter permease protein n=1 Tax=Haladaptatus paucihalophilus DX253 TaxID=797209 RepID=E7QYZ5_HALPU|nr:MULTISPECIES: iron ABC transporter permease [Haladaptatus]EFW90411.1 iron ABC transporter permease protein [Haladaptatus paucihalophilus DX253]GKZ13315.1 iron ABC transporter permease [Haladaptatus sp. T7]SHK03776.1 iron(III) transport system permease protein [Haladaptatus paucihalophilus DX253]
MATRDRLRRLADSGGDDESTPVGLTLVSGAVAAAVLFPVLWLVVRVFGMDANRIVSMLTRGATLTVLGNSVALIVAVTAGSILIGVPLAVLTVQTDLPFRRFWTVVGALPLVVPSYIGAFAFVSAFGPQGELADALAPLGVESIPSMYGFFGAALVLTLFTYPYVFLTTRASLLSFDDTLVEAARTLNHSRWEAFKRVTIPQILPGIAAGSLLVALYALSDFGTPTIMHFEVFTQQIYVQYNAWGRDFASLLSLQLVAVTVVILALESRINAGTNGGSRGSNRSAVIELGAWRYPALLFSSAVAVLCLVVPLGMLVFWMLRADPTYGSSSFAFHWEYAWNSVGVSGMAAIFGVLAAIPVAYLSARHRSTVATVLDRATYVGYAVPGIVLGLALVSFGSAYAPALYQTIPLLVFAYIVRFLPQAVGTVRSSVLQVNPKLTEAAQTLGYSPGAAFRKVTLPLIAPGVAAGAALVFLTTMKELPATLLLRPPEFETFVTYIWKVQGAGHYGKAAIPALILVGISGLSLLIIIKQEDYDVK